MSKCLMLHDGMTYAILSLSLQLLPALSAAMLVLSIVQSSCEMKVLADSIMKMLTRPRLSDSWLFSHDEEVYIYLAVPTAADPIEMRVVNNTSIFMLLSKTKSDAADWLICPLGIEHFCFSIKDNKYCIYQIYLTLLSLL